MLFLISTSLSLPAHAHRRACRACDAPSPRAAEAQPKRQPASRVQPCRGAAPGAVAASARRSRRTTRNKVRASARGALRCACAGARGRACGDAPRPTPGTRADAVLQLAPAKLVRAAAARAVKNAAPDQPSVEVDWPSGVVIPGARVRRTGLIAKQAALTQPHPQTRRRAVAGRTRTRPQAPLMAVGCAPTAPAAAASC
jgi:hypothetical protein